MKRSHLSSLNCTMNRLYDLNCRVQRDWETSSLQIYWTSRKGSVHGQHRVEMLTYPHKIKSGLLGPQPGLLRAALRRQSPAAREEPRSGLPIARAAHHPGHLRVLLPLPCHAPIVVPELPHLQIIGTQSLQFWDSPWCSGKILPLGAEW